MILDPFMLIGLFAGSFWFVLHWLFCLTGKNVPFQKWSKRRYRWAFYRGESREPTDPRPPWSWSFYCYLADKCEPFGLQNPARIMHWAGYRPIDAKRLAVDLVQYEKVPNDQALPLLEMFVRERVLKRTPNVRINESHGSYSIANRRYIDDGYEFQVGKQTTTTATSS